MASSLHPNRSDVVNDRNVPIQSRASSTKSHLKDLPGKKSGLIPRSKDANRTCDISDDILYIDGLSSCRILKQPAAIPVSCPPIKPVRTVRFAPLPQEGLQTRSTWCPATPPTAPAASATYRSNQIEPVSPFMDLLQKHKTSSTHPAPDPPSVPALGPETGLPTTTTPATGAEDRAVVPENLPLISASVIQSVPPITSSVAATQSGTATASIQPPSASIAASEPAALLLQQRPDFATIRSSPLWPTLRLLSDSAWAAFVHMHSTLLGDAYVTVEADRQARHHETELKERKHKASLASCRTELQSTKSEVEKMTAELAARDRLLDQTRADATKLGAESEARRVRDTDALRAQLSKLETELQDARNENAVVRSEMTAVHSENKGLREEQRRSRELVSKLEAKISWLLFGRASEG